MGRLYFNHFYSGKGRFVCTYINSLWIDLDGFIIIFKLKAISFLFPKERTLGGVKNRFLRQVWDVNKGVGTWYLVYF